MKNVFIVVIALATTLSCSKKSDTQKINQQNKATTQIQDNDYIETDFYFKLPLYTGDEVDLKDLRGKAVLVMFFTENCPYCRKAAPFIEAIYEKYSSKGLEVVAISVKPDIESAKEFATDFNLKFKVAYNGRDVARRYGISGVPFVYLLNKDHTLNKLWAGYDKIYEDEIDKAISKII